MHILLKCDGSTAFMRTLRGAVGCAERHGALLRGLYYTADTASVDDRATARELFQKAAAESEVCAEWIDEPDADLHRFLHHAYTSDLIVIGQPPPYGGDGDHQLAERLLHLAGRPVVVVPYAGQHRLRSERVLVTWSEGRESARALLDALPFLQAADRVTLLRVMPVGVLEERYDDILAFLAHHGVKAHVEVAPCGGLEIGDVILNHACEEGSDLIIMGACDPRRETNRRLGAVAGHLLRLMTVPVLMSH